MSLTRRGIPVLLCLLFVCACTLCRAEPLRVITLHGVLEEFARRIGGEEAMVDCLIPSGTDPHGFSPAPGDVRRIAAADLVIANGFELEPWLGRLVRNSGTRATVLEASAFLEAAAPKHDAATGGVEQDPHWWHGLRAAEVVARGITEGLCRLRPAAAEGFRSRQAALEAEIAALSRWSTGLLARLPEQRRQLVTSHDAFGYLARELGFSVHPLNGLNPEAEADARSLARLIDFVSKNKIHSVFPDNTENPRVLAAMTREAGARLGGTLYADGPGGPGTPAPDFAAMYRYNLSTIVEGLLPPTEPVR